MSFYFLYVMLRKNAHITDEETLCYVRKNVHITAEECVMSKKNKQQTRTCTYY